MSEEQAARAIHLRHRLRAMASRGRDGAVSQTLDELRALAEQLQDPTLEAEHLRWRTFFEQLQRRAA